MEKNNLSKNLTCILFPGIVKDFDKAIDHLGGIDALEKAVTGKTSDSRIQLSFHPKNPYAKRISSEKTQECGLLLKIKIRKKKVDGIVKKEVFHTNVVGKVTEIYKFEGLMDLQYLPLLNEKPGEKPKCIFEHLVPEFLSSAEFLKKKPPLFLPPAFILKYDKPTTISYMDKVLRVTDQTKDENNLRMVKKVKFVSTMTFNIDKPLPTKPLPVFLTRMEENCRIWPKLKEHMEIISKVLEERPIISRYTLAFETKLPLYNLKVILPCLAVYVNGGPWHSLWMRYGYDPRKEPGARVYQILDVRLNYLEKKRKAIPIRTPSAQKKRQKKGENIIENDADDMPDESWFRLRPGHYPQQKQVFYQLCEIYLPEVQGIMSRLPEVMPGALCHPKRGWLPPGALEEIRTVVHNYLDTASGKNSVEFGSDLTNSDGSDLDQSMKSEEDEAMETGD